MKKSLAIFMAILSLNAFAGPKVVLKLDDFSVKNGKVSCTSTIELLAKRGVKASFGIIAQNTDETLKEGLASYHSMKAADGSPLFEFWHHGLDHKRPEFSGTTYEYQKMHFDKADSIVLARGGFQMTTFGSPYNSVDENTAKVISESGKYTHVFYVPEAVFEPTGLKILNSRVNMENGTGNVNFKHFEESYTAAAPHGDFIVLQGHPNGWDAARLEEFTKILNFLEEKGWTFVLPSEIPCDSPTIIRANALLSAPDITIVNKKAVPPSGDKHDYVSMGPYWWPDPNKPDGLPYIRRDGEINPERDNYTDNKNFGKMSSSVQLLAKAYAQTGDEKYAARGAKFLNTFFVVPETRMNPNIEYGQFIPGRTNGRAEGIIETSSVPELINAITILQSSESWLESLDKGLKSWMSDYYKWLTTSKIGLDEMRATNNHATYFDAQCLAILPWLGREKEARNYFKKVTLPRLGQQIMPDGSQPKELARTKSFSYSSMNLKGFIKIAHLAENLGFDLWSYKKNGQVYLKSMIDWFIPYLLKEKEWAWKQITNDSVTVLKPFLEEAAVRYKDNSYIDVVNRLAPISDNIGL